MKRCTTSCVIKKLQSKTVVRYHYLPVRMAQIQNADITKY